MKAGRPQKPNQKKLRQMLIMVEPAVRKKLEEKADREHVSLSHLGRRALREMLERDSA